MIISDWDIVNIHPSRYFLQNHWVEFNHGKGVQGLH